MSILYGATCIVGIICMVAFLFMGVWLFITALKSYQQLRYKNYILEKIYQKINIISEAYCNEKEQSPDDMEDSFYSDEDKKISHIDERKNFNK